MYLDSVILFALFILICTCLVVAYLGYYTYTHVKQDERKAATQKRSLTG